MPEYSDDLLKDILTRTRTIALVGASANPERPSFRVGQFLAARGYRVIPVNPGLAGQELWGQTVAASLAEIDEPVDMVDIFRRSEAVGPIVTAALAAFPGLQTVWMQLGVENAAAAAQAEERGVLVIQNRCPKIEYDRLMS
ncbi:CoA-binding protein [Pseudodonghicola flavimaris]|uniref:CoA-binding protein n=1 Tax=Pseudodonghicola flavimaris TaxID=3050036 RepID=A0ABT7F086_9RHOB|nr:CoA-binding protein [Pseudodonghicola flavimaris]MDK3018021.1 CoA-binding protein [Pseudodonghicola flavimaris]